MRRRMKHAIYVVGGFALVAPILPFYFARQTFEAAVKGIDWMIEGRKVPVWLTHQLHRLEIWSLN